MKDISLKEMLNNAVHFGHRTHRWNPKMKPYIYTSRKGIHVINLHKTAEKLKIALEFIKDSSSKGKKILFVGTKLQATRLLEIASKKTGMPVVSYKWISGLLTNFKTIKQRVKQMKKIRELFETNGIKKYTKKEQVEFKKDLDKLTARFGGIEEMVKLPDVLFVIDCVKEKNAIKEAKKLGIPVIGIVDTVSDPDLVDFVIPGNDDAVKSLTYFIESVTDAIVEGKKEKTSKK